MSCYSIFHGIAAGFITYTLVKIFKELSQGCAFYDLDFGSSHIFEFRKSGFKLGLNIAGFPWV